MDTGGDSHLWGVLSNLEWDLIKWVLKSLGGAGVFTVLVEFLREVRGGTRDWWFLGAVFVVSLSILYAVTDRPQPSSLWVELIPVLCVAAVVGTAVRMRGVDTTPNRVSTVAFPPLSPQDDANRKKIALLFRVYGCPASLELQQIARGVINQFYQLCDSEAKIGAQNTEGLTIIAQLAHEGPYILWSQADSRLRKGIEGPVKVSGSALLCLLEDFFRAYQGLVRWVNRLDQFQLSFVAENKEHLLKFKSACAGKEYASWQDKHKVFHQKLRELLVEDDFSKSQTRLEGYWRDTF